MLQNQHVVPRTSTKLLLSDQMSLAPLCILCPINLVVKRLGLGLGTWDLGPKSRLSLSRYIIKVE